MRLEGGDVPLAVLSNTACPFALRYSLTWRGAAAFHVTLTQQHLQSQAICVTAHSVTARSQLMVHPCWAPG